MLEQATLFIAVLTVAAYAYRSDFNRYSIATTGVFERVERSAVTGGDMDSIDMQCADCGTELVTAERRHYWREMVICGAVVYKRDAGTAYYCEDHVSFELRDDLNNATHIYADRLPIGLLEALGRFIAHTPDIDTAEDSELGQASDIPTTAGSVMTLIPAVVLILCAVPVLKLLDLYTQPAVE